MPYYIAFVVQEPEIEEDYGKTKNLEYLFKSNVCFCLQSLEL